MQTRQEFEAEFQRCAARLQLDKVKVLRILEADMADGGQFINVIAGVRDKPYRDEYFVVTTRSVYSIKSALFKTKVNWSVPVSAITSFEGSSNPFKGHVGNEISVETGGKTNRFRFGFDQDGSQAVQIATGNMQSAVLAVQSALEATRYGGS